MATLEHKKELIATVMREVQTELAVLLRAARDATDDATHEENRAEGDKDMRATEASYRARGQWQRVRDLEQEAAQLTALVARTFGSGDPVALGALVTLEYDDGATARVIVLPGGGGREVLGVRVITPRSPLGSALIGLRTGDGAIVVAAGKEREATLVAVG